MNSRRHAVVAESRHVNLRGFNVRRDHRFGRAGLQACGANLRR